MTRSLCFVLALFCLAPCTALAQETSTHAHAEMHERLSLDPSNAAELASINSESQIATGLYATALTLHLGGLAIAVAGSAAGLCITSSCSDGERTAQAWAAGGAIAAAVGLLMFIPAIILDVDSGRRRSRLGSPHVALSIGAGGIGIEGSF